MNATELTRPVALVTGAARGIGAACAARLAADGWAVGLVDICADIDGLSYGLATRDDLDASVAACGPHAVGIVADVRSGDQLATAVAETVAAFGGLDAAVAAAGVITGGSTLWETSEADWALNLDVCLGGVWRTAAAAVPEMLKRPKPRRGRFVAIASAAGLRAQPSIGPYSAAKHGVVGMVKSLAAELGARGITANAVAPGSTETDILRASAAVYHLDSTEEFAVHHVTRRIIAPAEISNAVAFLCGPDAASITGTVVSVDGGMSI